MSLIENFELVFPTIYGKASKSDQIAEKLFKDVINCVKNDCELFEKKEKKKVVASLTKAAPKAEQDTMQVIFQCSYGCAIVIKKERKQSPIDMYIVAPQQWSSGAHDWNQNSLDFCQPKSKKAYYMPRIAENHYDLKTFVESFRAGLQTAKSILGNISNQKKQQFEYSAKTIHKACKMAVDTIGIFTNYNYPLQDKKQTQQDKKQKKDYHGEVQNIELSKSQANTSWYVPQAVLIDLISSQFQENCKEIYEKIIISYLGHLLEKVTAEKSNQQIQDSIKMQREMGDFKRCLDLIIQKYKKSISVRKKPVNLLKKFMKLIEKIQENIDKLSNNGLTSKIDDKPQVAGALPFTEPRRAGIKKPQVIKHHKQRFQLAKVVEYPIIVGKRLPFEQLLRIGDNIESKKLKQKSKWVLLVEKTFFSITEIFRSDEEIIDLDIHMREIECEIGASNLCKIVQLYEKVIKSDVKHFGYGLESQSKCLIQLIKTIAAVIAFESVKMNRQRKQSNLKDYRIPIDIEVFYQGFESNSYGARRAIKSLKQYHDKRKNKKPIFLLDGSVSSFEQYGKLVAKDTRSAYVWIDNMKTRLSLQKQLIVERVMKNDYYQRFEKAMQKWTSDIKSSSNYMRTYGVSCQQEEVLIEFNENDPWLFAFLENIPPDILGMMKVLYLAQNPKEDYKKHQNNIFRNHLDQQLSIKPYIQLPKLSNNYYSASNISSSHVAVNTSFYSKKIIFNGCLQSTLLTVDSFQTYNRLFHQKEENQLYGSKINYLLERPDTNVKNRQHKLYANQSQKPKDIQNEDFLAIGNVRSGKYTQLMVLCSNILQHKIISNSYEQKCLLSEEVILHTIGQTANFNPKVQKEFKQVTKLLSGFIDVWGFTDVNFCPILGPLFGYLSRELIDSKILDSEQQEKVKEAVLKLCEKCIEEFNRGEEQLKQKPAEKIQWTQRFITMAAIICFRESLLTIKDQKQILILCELVFQLRTCQILSGREEKPAGLREFEKQLMFSVAKTIYNNIEVMSQLLEKRLDQIEKIILKMDPSYPKEVEWKKVNMFAFQGDSKSSEDIYQIDIFHGKIFKNGKEISALDEKIKSSEYFKKVFGQQREFQVFQSHNANFVRTKNTVNHYFKIPQTVGKVFLEFSQDGKEIRHIYQRAGEQQKNEQTWILIPRQTLRRSKCHIPKIFVDDHLAWYQQTRNCMVFRREKLEEIYNIGMVLHFDGAKADDMLNLQIGFHITYNGSFQNQDLNQICDKQKAKKVYNEIKLRSQDEDLNEIKCLKLLSRFEPVEYIFELKNKNGQIEYFMHRYQSKFALVENTRLESQSYFGYSIDAGFEEDDNSLFKRFPCLILKKHSKRPQLLNSHQRICIVSDGEVLMGGEIRKKVSALEHIDSYKYQIHDFFGDLRGSSRQSLLHLSAIMLSINDNIRISSIQKTPLDYSIYLLNSCINNIPLSKREMIKIDNMVKKLQAPESVILMLQALWTCSKILVDILPFKQENERSYFNALGQKLMMCRTLYEEKFLEGSIRHGQRLQPELLKLLGLKYSRQVSQIRVVDSESSSSSSQSHCSDSDSNYSSVEEEKGLKFWIGQKKFTCEKLLPEIEQIQSRFEEFNKLSKLIKEMWEKKKSQQGQGDSQNTAFPTKIKQLTNKSHCNPMTKEMIQDMEESYNTFNSEEKRIDEIIKTVDEEKRTFLLTIVEELSNKAMQILGLIENVIDQIKKKTSQMPDYISGERPTLSYVMFTKILCQKGMIREFLPHLTSETEKKVLSAIKIWVQLKTRKASFDRIKQLLSVKTIDYVALMRQMQSPRKEVRERNYWLCYEAENKMQLWLSQLDTYNNLKNRGDFCQLNMGEGKTQVIIPMMILECTYGGLKQLPRINLLSSLIQEARGNFFRFLGVTGFQLYGFEIPFTREVHLTQKTKKMNTYDKNRKILQAKQSNVQQVQDLIGTFESKLYVLMTRESRLSQILRYYETHEIDSRVSMQSCPLILKRFKVFDIFDEIDELMNPLKSYIFSIGTTIPLPEEKVRLEVLRVLIETFLKKHVQELLKQKMIISEETEELTLMFVREGKYPPGLRLNMAKFTPSKLKAFKKSLAENTIEQLKHDYFSFYKKLKKVSQQKLVEFIINPTNVKLGMPSFVKSTWTNQILILRGAIGFGIFEHCLSMRCGVDYGVPGPDHKKKIAVPYDAADIPSKTSEYQHPDLSSVLSYCAYYTKGLSFQQFEEALKRLLSLSATSKEVQYKAWFVSLSQQTQGKAKVKQAQQININSKALVQQLFMIYRRNRRTISFWLNKCIFPSNLKQYTQSITASAWDFADVSYSVGFSGTKDNRWLYSNMLNWKPCETASIKGTDGKMIHLITKCTLDIKLIPQTEDSQWQRFINTALGMEVGCIIDAGALCVGKSLQNEIVPWIAKHSKFDHSKYHGISFCDQYGRWKVYDIEAKYSIRRGTSIPDHETFVLFDEARTRGADLKMGEDVVAAISLGPKMTKDKFMQAAGRLRKLGRNQKLIIMATQQIFATLLLTFDQSKIIKQVQQRSSSVQRRQQFTHQILSWCCKNAIEQNERLLIQFSNLGWDYIRSKEDKRIYIKDISSELSAMYEHGLEKTTVAKLNEKKASGLPSKYVSTLAGQEINRKLNLYGDKVEKQASTLDDVCEREVQPQPEVQKSQQDPYSQLIPISEVSNPAIKKDISGINVIFDKNFVLSENFVNTTEENQVSITSANAKSKQLGELYFVIQNQEHIKAITLRQASEYIYNNVIGENAMGNEKIRFLSGLTIDDEDIKKNKLQAALMSAKFVSGVQNYSQEELEHLVEIFIESGKVVEEEPEKFEKLTSSILKKKRVYYKKYFGSSLEKLVITLKNEDKHNPEEENGEEDAQNVQELQMNEECCESSESFEPMDVELPEKMDEE